ncbi:MAG: DNA alkylation repair protein [Acidobacteria bacterium]|nr:DNA alkylation repair protein [Acidobacteriota bacterium]
MTRSPGATTHRGSSLAVIRRDLRRTADAARAAQLGRYFKTGPGGYGEGDRFLGLTLSAVRASVRAHSHASLAVLETLLTSRWHEERTLALLILVRQHAAGTPEQRRRIVSMYLRHRKHVNNWDLVDCSAPGILGAHWADADGGRLAELAASPSVWDRRIAVLATAWDIRQGRFDRTFALAEQLLGDPHDLIHKAVGWMLREVGKQDRRALEQFLDRHAATMPRTMLRYAVEKFPTTLRQEYLGRPRARRDGRRAAKA